VAGVPCANFQSSACRELPRQAGESFLKLPGYENKHSISSNHMCSRLLYARPKHASGKPTAGRRLSRTNTAEGQHALLDLTTGMYNTTVGLYSLLSNTTGKFNTGVGAGALLTTPPAATIPPQVLKLCVTTPRATPTLPWVFRHSNTTPPVPKTLP
jgi:hypothetical protein